jgi:hypothetical protein
MRTGLLGYLSACVCLGLFAVLAGCGTGDPNAVQSAQQTVDAIAGVQPGQMPAHFRPEEPADIPRAEGDWDVNAYFGVLDHLTVEPGYVIDYLYVYDGMGGYPFIYARPADKSPYASREEYLVNVPGGGQDSAGDIDYAHEYLNHIKIDDTREGYFEFVALRIMDSQFYQFWHAGYNDTTIVCDKDALEKTLAAAGDAFEGSGVPSSVVRAAGKIDLAPTVEFADNTTALVRLVTFTKWGGFAEVRYTIDRRFPQTVLDTEATTLVEYDCGVSF